MTQPVFIIADVVAVAGRGDELFTLIQDLVAPTRAEDGNLAYDVVRSLDEPDLFYFVERWRDRAAFEAHLVAEHVADYDRRSGHLIGRAVQIIIGQQLTAGAAV